MRAASSAKYKLRHSSLGKGLEKRISQNVLVSAATYPLYLEYFRGSVAIVTLGRFGLIGTLGKYAYIYDSTFSSVEVSQGYSVMTNELLKIKATFFEGF